MHLFEYRFDRIIKGNPPFPETVDYRITVPCVNRDESLEYVFRLYCFETYLYITDFYPKMYENDNRRFHRFTSHEGYTVDMRRISVTCLWIFMEHFLGEDPRNTMVVSGSYQDDEPQQGPSRKLKLYQYFFYPLLDQFHLRSVEMPEENAFMLTSRSSPISDEKIKQCYLTFKSQSHGRESVGR